MNWLKKLTGNRAAPEPPEAPSSSGQVQWVSMPWPTTGIVNWEPAPLRFTPGPAVEVGPSVDADKLESLKTSEPFRVTPRVPDRVEVITAWRAWCVDYDQEEGYRLEALGRDAIWEPRKIFRAVCDEDEEHPAPCADCQCGIWAFKELDGLVAAIGNKYGAVRVLGNVQLWGRVIETENGYRAQYAYPSELWLLDSSLEELGLIYDVPVRMIRA